MAWCAFLHGFLFGMIQIEGPHPGVGAPLLLGFGIVTAFLPGIPLGMVVPGRIGIPRAERRSAARPWRVVCLELCLSCGFPCFDVCEMKPDISPADRCPELDSAACRFLYLQAAQEACPQHDIRAFDGRDP